MELNKQQAQNILALLPSITLSGKLDEVATKAQEFKDLEAALTAFVSAPEASPEAPEQVTPVEGEVVPE